MTLRGNSLFVTVSALISFSFCSYACTDFKLTSKDNTVIISRSMEFAADLKSNLRTSPRGRVFNTTTPNNKPGLSWKAKYGYVYVDGFGVDASFDGMNEAGLTFEYLYLPGETHYQSIPAGKDGQTIPYSLLGDWVLANFQTIDEVKEALKKVYVSNQTIPQLGDTILPAHASIYDASGKGIVVEFYDERINLFDNIGVMTNSPKYDWHVTNLSNYINLSADTPQTIQTKGISLASLGQGSGAVGLPGDASPPSRFVKVAFMLKNVFPANNVQDLLNLAQHIMNNVDLPSGYVRSVDNGQTATDITQWVVFKDITHKTFYYRTYNDMTLHKVAMDKLSFSENAPRLKMSLQGEPNIMNVTDQFLQTGK
ncbi:linear amide C-N hydrolase [Legionella fallonii]|uniref:Putative penicillin amidase n=1 Tax=Legionella fallonii LLAP-10 TaxID=1212491 RepID=A0A098G7Z1_9GAMM|nr:linear amide C-N hydrolase [Legionella fallonii]CEG58079.1 putative penicillin amidase [Legionella fallonii LLAP-10]